MTPNSNIKLTIAFNDPDLDADERDEQALSAKVKLRDTPGGGDTEKEVRGHRDGGGHQREFHR